MRLKIALLLWKTLLLLSGFGLLFAAVFAVQLGIDNDPGWGRGRVVMFLMGIALLVTAAVTHCWSRLQRLPTIHRLATWLHPNGGRAAPLQSFTTAQTLPRSRARAAIFAGTGVLITGVVYLWYLTAGVMGTIPLYTAYFDRLANAFLAGEVTLLEKPSPELLALENPYDWQQRGSVDYVWDASLYRGRFSFYWGPVPALLAAGVKAAAGPFTGPLVIEDQHLILFFCIGLSVLFAFTLLLLRSAVFPDAPAWTLLPLVLLFGLSVPMLWLINTPGVYEAAISSGQFFLILGLYATLRALLATQSHPGWLLLAGLAWGAAVCSRLTLAPAVGFFCTVAAWVTFQRRRTLATWVAQLAWLAVPLILWAAALGWYNFARFGNPLETGHRYQLTGPALPQDYRHVTSLSYVLPSLYSYLARPLSFNPREFPFVFAPYVRETDWPFFIHLPDHYYYPEPVAGLPLAIPGLCLALLPLTGLVSRAWRWLHEAPPLPAKSPLIPNWLWVLMAGGALALFAPLTIFITTTMRYLADVTPMLALVASLGFWWGLRVSRSWPGLRAVISLSAVGLILLSVGLSLLLNFNIGPQRFLRNNPELYQAIARFLTP